MSLSAVVFGFCNATHLPSGEIAPISYPASFL
jgi:hypothetical protein